MSFILIKVNSYIYLFLTIIINFITDLLESNRYNILYIVMNHNLTKTIVLILYIKIIDIIRIEKLGLESLHYNNFPFPPHLTSSTFNLLSMVEVYYYNWENMLELMN